MEWSVFVLKVLSELGLVLLAEDDEDAEENEERTTKKGESNKTEGQAAERAQHGKSHSKIISLFTESLLPRLVSFPNLCLTVSLYSVQFSLCMSCQFTTSLLRVSPIISHYIQSIQSKTDPDFNSIIDNLILFYNKILFKFPLPLFIQVSMRCRV